MCCIAMLMLCLGFLSVWLALDFFAEETFSLRLEFGIEYIARLALLTTSLMSKIVLAFFVLSVHSPVKA